MKKKIELAVTIVLLTVIVFGYLYVGGAFEVFSITYKSYKDLPLKLKQDIEYFSEQAKKNGKSVEGLDQISFKIGSPLAITLYSGQCNQEKKTIFLRKDSQNSFTIWHELGHCLYDYPHSLDEKSIMYYTVQKSELIVLSNEQIKTFFNYNESISTTSNIELLFRNPSTSIMALFMFLPFLLIFGLIIKFWLKMSFSKKD